MISYRLGFVVATIVIGCNSSGPRPHGQTAKMVVAGYGHPLASGAAAATDFGTDFGVVQPGALPIVRRFTVRNEGGDVLALTSINVSGSGFALTETPPTMVLAGKSTTFAVSFAAPGAGVFDGEITVAGNDVDHPSTTFALRGRQVTGTPHDFLLSDKRPTSSTITYPAMVSLSGHGMSDVLMMYWDYPSGLTQPLVYENDGAGHLSDATATVFGGSPPSMDGPHRYAVADFDGDGRSDIFIAENGSDLSPWPGAQNTLLLQKAAGQLIDASGNLPPLIADNYNIAVGDIDGNGTSDLWIGDVFCQTRTPPHFIVNDGTAHFTDAIESLPPLVNYPAGGHIFYAAALVDVNLDGFLDLILGNSATSGKLAADVVLLGDGKGTFTESANALPPRLGGVLATPEYITSADFNNDGWPDLIVATEINYDKGAIQLLLNNGDGTFSDATNELPMTDWSSDNWDGTSGTNWFYAVVPVDIDGDGRMDFVTEGNLIKSALLQQGAQGFTQARVFDRPTSADMIPYWVQPTDMDGDGVADYLIFSTAP